MLRTVKAMTDGGRIGSPVANDRGTLSELPHWAGTGVDAIRDIPSAADLVSRLWRECLAAT